MVSQDPVIRYCWRGSTWGGKGELLIHKNGEIFIEREFRKIKEKKSILVHPDRVKSYAERLIKSGFLDFKDNYDKSMFDATTYWMQLNYRGKSKTVTGYPQLPLSQSKEFSKLFHELQRLFR